MAPVSNPSRDKRGIALTEFALVSPVLFMVLLGIFDLGHRAYLYSVLYGAVQKAGRDATLETGPAQMGFLKSRIEEQINPILLGSTLNIQYLATKSFTAASGGEPFTDTDGDGVRDAGECYDDENGNSSWDAAAGTSGTMGGTDDVVTYKATVTFNHIFPFPSLLGLPSNDQLTAMTVLRNQPYGEAATVARVCT